MADVPCKKDQLKDPAIYYKKEAKKKMRELIDMFIRDSC